MPTTEIKIGDTFQIEKTTPFGKKIKETTKVVMVNPLTNKVLFDNGMELYKVELTNV